MNSQDKKLRHLYRTDPVAYWKQAYDDHTPVLILQKPYDRNYLLTFYIVPYIENTIVAVSMQRNGIPVGVDVEKGGSPQRKSVSNFRSAAIEAENLIVRKGYLIAYESPQSPILLNHRRMRKGLSIRGYDDNFDYYLERQERPVKEATDTRKQKSNHAIRN